VRSPAELSVTCSWEQPRPGCKAFRCDAATLERAKLWNLVTDCGRVDIIFEPSGTQGFEDRNAETIRQSAVKPQILAAGTPFNLIYEARL